jgi:hypothetical protein
MSLESFIAEASEDLTPEQKDELIKRVAASVEFQRALRLRKFLLYIGKASTLENPSELREQDIGIKVFGRSPDYDRASDNIVRVNATELRKRIDHYFTGEGANEPYVFQVPRGAYKLVFSRRAASDSSSPSPAIDVEPGTPLLPHTEVSSGQSWMWVSIALGLLCVVLLAVVYHLQRPSEVVDRRPAVMRFWRAFTRASEPGAQTDLILSDESLSLMEDILRKPVNLPAYVDRSYLNAVETAPVSDDRKADVREVLHHNLVTLGSVMAAQQIITLPGLTEHFHVTVPRLYPADLMKRNNLIILGGKKSNPWAGFFDDRLNFTLEYNTVTSQNFVLNHHPGSGEQANYQPDENASLPGGIAVIAYISNPFNTGDVLLLTGSDATATEAATEFITSESSFEQLQKQFGQSQLPHFELVLRTTRLSGTSFTSEIVASRLR